LFNVVLASMSLVNVEDYVGAIREATGAPVPEANLSVLFGVDV
jgi:hypothetical protein